MGSRLMMMVSRWSEHERKRNNKRQKTKKDKNILCLHSFFV